MDKTILNKIKKYYKDNESTKQYLQIMSTALERQKPMQDIIDKYSLVTIRKYGKKYFNQYTEVHHIIPRSIDKKLEKYKPNWVILTGEEHFICHKLLVDMCINKGHHYSMCGAYGSMCFMDHGHESTPEEYAAARKLYAEAKSNKMTGVKRGPSTEEAKINLGNARRGKTYPNLSKAKSGIALPRSTTIRAIEANSEPLECYIILENKELVLGRFKSSSEAGRMTGINSSGISNSADVNNKSAGTYNLNTKQYNEINSTKHPLPNNKYPSTYKCYWRKIKE